METLKVSAKGQVVLPARIRKKYGIHPGGKIQLLEYDNLIYLIPPSEDPVKEAKGCLPPKPSLSKQLLEERQRDSKK
ncbi:transcriptional regulator, AbrB family [Desulfosarcina variabilis str. Montpellier]|uniref:AbrB/MazE/SpoVT family DNA-binding domain-containing protein n=1 Tax=Desulfosarcina variabilis TaxID=2300 RepID=UPI003AFAFADB